MTARHPHPMPPTGGKHQWARPLDVLAWLAGYAAGALLQRITRPPAPQPPPDLWHTPGMQHLDGQLDWYHERIQGIYRG